MAKLFTLLDERWTPAVQLSQADAYARLGLADAAICHLAESRTKVLSVDAKLCHALWHRGSDVENFNHLRQLG